MKKYFENFDVNKLNYTFDELNEILENNDVEYDCYNLAYQMTAYEQGYIDYKDGLKDLLEVDFSVSDYNEYLVGNAYETYIEFNEDTFNQYFSSPWEAMRACNFGSVNFNDDYFTFDGYGNIETKSEDDIIQEANEHDDFILMMLEEQYEDLFEEDFKEDIIKMTLHLVKQGF